MTRSGGEVPSDVVGNEYLLEFSTEHLRTADPVEYFDAVAQVVEAFQSLDANLLNSVLPSARVRLSVDRLNSFTRT